MTTATFPPPLFLPTPPRQGRRQRTSAVAGRPLSAGTGAEIQAPLIQGGHVRYANLDYAATAPALSAVRPTSRDPALLRQRPPRRRLRLADQHPAYENARAIVRAFVGGRPDDSVIFTRNTTDSLNLLAGCVPAADGVRRRSGLPGHRAPREPAAVAGVPAPQRRRRSHLAATIELLRARARAGGVSLLAVTGASNVTGEILPIRAGRPGPRIRRQHRRRRRPAGAAPPHRHRRGRRRLPRLLRPQALRAVRRRGPGRPPRLARRRHPAPRRRRSRAATPGSTASAGPRARPGTRAARPTSSAPPRWPAPPR